MAILGGLNRRLARFRISGPSRAKSKRHEDGNTYDSDATSSTVIPENTLPGLLPVELPLILPEHRYNLADQGWSTVTFPDDQTELLAALQELLRASKGFFENPTEYKERFTLNHGSEEGWTRIEGEKEFITLRSLSKTPEELKEPASKVWAASGALLNEMLAQIAKSMELEPDVFIRFSEPCLSLDGVRRATMMRLFRYENSEEKVVAEPHSDLGLLSLVMGDTPGLEVWNRYQQDFVAIEQLHSKPTASVLVGRQLERFTNGRYLAGGHRVCAYDSETFEKYSHRRMDSRYRFSIVFVLRAHWPVLIDTDTMTSRISGDHVEKIQGRSAYQLFQDIHSKHYNVNIGHEKRERQKMRMIEDMLKAAEAPKRGTG